MAGRKYEDYLGTEWKRDFQKIIEGMIQGVFDLVEHIGIKTEKEVIREKMSLLDFFDPSSLIKLIEERPRLIKAPGVLLGIRIKSIPGSRGVFVKGDNRIHEGGFFTHDPESKNAYTSCGKLVEKPTISGQDDIIECRDCLIELNKTGFRWAVSSNDTRAHLSQLIWETALCEKPVDHFCLNSGEKVCSECFAVVAEEVVYKFLLA